MWTKHCLMKISLSRESVSYNSNKFVDFNCCEKHLLRNFMTGSVRCGWVHHKYCLPTEKIKKNSVQALILNRIEVNNGRKKTPITELE